MNLDFTAQQALDRLAKVGADALPERDKTIATVWLFLAGVSNGGFSGYYSGKRGNLAFHAPVALRVIGATELAGIAEEANALFGPDGPPADRTARRAVLTALPESARLAFEALDERYFASEEDVDGLLEAYIAREVESR